MTASGRDRAFSIARATAAAVVFGVALLLLGACSDPVRPTLTAEALGDATDSANSTDPALPSPTSEPAPASSNGEANTAVPAATATAATPDTTGTASSDGAESAVEDLVVEVLESFPHDPNAFTQGLELHDGDFIESTGLYGESDLRRVDPATGAIEQRVTIPAEFFAEGVTRVGDRLIQLTWQENTAFYWDLATFQQTQSVSYEGEGWGLCYDGTRLVMTDGTPEITFRDPTTFGEIDRVSVTLNGQPVYNLNEIECVDGTVWANIWQTDLIVRIDPTTGTVTGVVDATSLDGPSDPNGAVLNGIAWDDTTQSFFVTGKLWPTMYRVRFVPAPNG